MKKTIIISSVIVVILIIGIFIINMYKKNVNNETTRTEFDWYSAIVPKEYTKDDNEDIFFKTTNQATNKFIKLYLENGSSSEMVNEILKKENYIDYGEKKIGKYTWRIIEFRISEELQTVQYYTQIDDNKYVQIITFCLGNEEKDVKAFLSSFNIN